MELLQKIHNAMGDCAEQLDHLNQHFPKLVSGPSLEGVDYWKGRVTNVQDHSKPARKGDNTEEIRKVAQRLVKTENLEDVLGILQEKHDVELNLTQLIELIGQESYLNVLRKEGTLILENAISYEQIATLWNDLNRPALGAPKWTAKAISMLVE